MYSNEDDKQTLKTRIIILLIGIVVLLIVGMFAFHFLEGWSYQESLYFSAISLMTRGQSNLFPTTFLSTIFTILYLFIGVCFVIYAITTLLSFYISYYQESVVKKAKNLVGKLQPKKEQKKPDKWIILKRKEKKN
ncbi:potassium channel family protein [Candidatus Woesearchaeota archaeon]|nr:potassium channel family protein [Candidatus Woesearchaeota archaeon]